RSEPQGNCSWLFLEEAIGIEYFPHSLFDRVLAAEWLAALHSAAWKVGRLPGLPDRDCKHYRRLLGLVRKTIQKVLRDPTLHREDILDLASLAADCETLEAHWIELEQMSCGFLPTIVHGDFVIKNVRIRLKPVPAALVVFDWEVAGWGSPAIDLTQF